MLAATLWPIDMVGGRLSFPQSLKKQKDPEVPEDALGTSSNKREYDSKGQYLNRSLSSQWVSLNPSEQVEHLCHWLLSLKPLESNSAPDSVRLNECRSPHPLTRS